MSIGYVSHDPKVYYAAPNSPTLRATASTCEPFKHDSALVPELSWVVDAMLPTIDLKSRFPFLIGPTGLAVLLALLTKSSKVSGLEH